MPRLQHACSRVGVHQAHQPIGNKKGSPVALAAFWRGK